MTKDLNRIELVNTEKGTKLEYQAEGLPKQSTYGHSFFGTLNAIGIAELQAKGINVNSEKDYCVAVAKAFGISENGIGNRGPKWDTPEDRNARAILVNGEQWNPPLTVKAVEKYEKMKADKAAKEIAEANTPVVAPVVSPTVTVVAPQAAQTDTTDEQDAQNIKLIIEYSKTHSADVIEKNLASKIGAEKAKQLMIVAQEVSKPKDKVVEAPVFNFDAPKEEVKVEQPKVEVKDQETVVQPQNTFVF